jgi:hypothetical protein
MTTLPLLLGLLGFGSPTDAVSPVGVVEIELTDPSRNDPLAEGKRRWRVDLYYPARPGTGTPRTYAHDAVLVAR